MYKKSCPVHEFYHGAEAEELREGIEKIIKTLEEEKRGRRTREALAYLLDKVDARDSVAYLEAQKQEEAELLTEATAQCVDPNCPDAKTMPYHDHAANKEEPEEDYGTCDECGAEDQNLTESQCENCCDEE